MSSKSIWQLDLEKVDNTDLDELREVCIKAGMLAPSTHNSQPWQVSLNEKGFNILVKTKSLPAADPSDAYAWISIGAFIENAHQVAACNGYELDVSVKNNNVAVKFKSGSKQSLNANEITRRYSEKRVFDSKPLADKTVDKLRAISREIYLTNDSKRIEELALLQYEASVSYQNDKLFARELSHWMKVRQRAKSGMHHRSSGLSRGKLVMGKLFLKVSPKILKPMAKKYLDLVISSNAVGFITVRRKGSEDYLEAGRILERLSLAASAENLSLTPLAAIIEYATSRQILQNLHAYNKHYPAIFFRLSDRKEPVYHTARKTYKMVVRS